MTFRTTLHALLIGLLALLPLGCDSGGDNDVPVPRTVAEADYTMTQSGLKIFDFVVGDGALVENGRAVQVHYNMWLENGQLIDSSELSGRPFTFVIGRGEVIQGWEEGVLGMRTGGERQLVIPSSLAYGPAGVPRAGIPPDATLIGEITVLAVGFVSDDG